MTENKTIAAILVAAGNSSRLPGEVPKVYREWGGKNVLEHALAPFQVHEAISQILVVANPEHERHYKPILDRHAELVSASAQFHGEEIPKRVRDDTKKFWVVSGGLTRQESVFNGLDALADNPPDWVLVHDAARPHVSREVIDRVIGALKECPAAVPAIAVKDTIKRGESGLVAQTLPRDALHAVQTPQGFHYTELLAAHIAVSGQNLTDDAAVMEAAGLPVQLVEGDEANQKLTTPKDWKQLQGGAETRVGQGFDVHQLMCDAQRPLMLCGVEIESELALKGHSDADVGLHALVDALLGAIGAGDIGEHFPPSDAQWKDADSADFVTYALRLVSEKGGHIVNVDITVIAQEPKLKPYKNAMRERVAALLTLAPERVNIKATTTEGLGFTGRKEGIAAQAVVSIVLSP